jgi:hypothetical protein
MGLFSFGSIHCIGFDFLQHIRRSVHYLGVLDFCRTEHISLYFLRYCTFRYAASCNIPAYVVRKLGNTSMAALRRK